MSISIVFVSNFLNHHQVNVADHMYGHKDVEYHFVETISFTEEVKRSGYPDFSDRPYLIRTYESEEKMKLARKLIDNADVVIIGSAPEEWLQTRLKNNKVTFHCSERWFKRGSWRLLDPRALWHRYSNHTRYRNKRSYMLCASGYTAFDTRKVFAYPNKCFKWGYFTKVLPLDVEKILEAQKRASRLRILYVSRFLVLKHPELPVQLARILKDRGVDFELNMYGSGQEFERIKRLIKELRVSDCVNLCGNRPNDEMLRIMREHHIFLFTSDRNEGWGAVVNEAMSNCCAVVAGNKIGSVPFLLQHKENGMVFKDRNLRDLIDQVLYLIENPKERERMVRNAYTTIKDVWSPANAAESLIALVKSAVDNNITPAPFGPCSIAK